MPAITAYYYPWDIAGAGFDAARLRAGGVDRVAIAASYHSVRAATPTHPGRRVVDAHEAALYVPVVEQAWADRALVPRDAAEWTGSENSFGEAAGIVRCAGLPVDAWTVLNHSTRLGRSNPQLCVTNVFGERYAYALCPSNSEVQDYAARLIDQVIRLGNPDGIILEAVGPLGYGHQNQHEKTDGADFSPTVQALLSICFCAGCVRLYQGAGIDAQAAHTSVRDAVTDGQTGREAVLSPFEGIQGRLLAVRRQVSARLAARVTELARSMGVERVVLNVSADPWATGPFLSAESVKLLSEPTKTVLLPCWGDAAASIEQLHGVREAVPADTAFAAYVLALPPKDGRSGNLLEEWVALAEAGFDELHIYHLGLASRRRQDAVFDAIASLASRA